MLKAFCSSHRCTGQTSCFSFAKMAEKEVSFGQTNCPDCGAVLMWKKKNKKSHIAERKKPASDVKRNFLD